MESYRKGQYYYARHGRHWGIWQWHGDDSRCGIGFFVKDVDTKEEAQKEVYRLNGWKEKTN